MNQFHTKQNQWQNKKCTTCNEQWPTRTHINNDMDPGSVPPCLQNMTQIEELLILRACPIMTVYHKHGGQLEYSGRVLNLPQNIQFINKLPVNVSDLPILTVTRQGAANTHHNFRVRREKVLHALIWLKHNNKCYTDIKINLDAVQYLPVDGIPDALLNLQLPDHDNEPMADEGPPTEQVDDTTCNNPSSSFIPCVQQTQTQEQAVRSTIYSWQRSTRMATNRELTN